MSEDIVRHNAPSDNSPAIIHVSFSDRTIPSCQDKRTGKVFVLMREVVKDIGLSWSSQRSKLANSKLFKDFTRCVDIETPGGVQQVIGLDLDMYPAWLAGINSEKVRPDLRETLLDYQRESAAALRDYWFTGQATHSTLTNQGHTELEHVKRELILITEMLAIIEALPLMQRLPMIKLLEKRHNIDLHPFFQVSLEVPALAPPPPAKLEPMKLARYLGILGKNPGAELNLMLGLVGWQKKVNGKWEPTAKGMPHAEKNLFTSEHSSYQDFNYRWNVKAVAHELDSCKSINDILDTREEFRISS